MNVEEKGGGGGKICSSFFRLSSPLSVLRTPMYQILISIQSNLFISYLLFFFASWIKPLWPVTCLGS